MLDWFWHNFHSDKHADVSIGKRVKDAINKMQIALYIDRETLTCIFFEIECAESRRGVEIGFTKLNKYLRFLLRVQPATESYGTVRAAVENLKTSEKFTAHLKRSSSLEEALKRWKTQVVQELSFKIQNYCEEERNRNKFDRELLQHYLPETSLANEREVKYQNLEKQYQKRSKRSRGVEDSGIHRKTEKKTRTADRDQVRPKKVCIYFKEGKCKRGQACRFQHIIC